MRVDDRWQAHRCAGRTVGRRGSQGGKSPRGIARARFPAARRGGVLRIASADDPARPPHARAQRILSSRLSTRSGHQLVVAPDASAMSERRNMSQGGRTERVVLGPSTRSLALASRMSARGCKRGPACQPKRCRSRARLRQGYGGQPSRDREGWREVPRRAPVNAERHPERAARWGTQRGPTERSSKWRRGDSHPGPKICPRRNLRCVSASVVSRPAWRGGKTAGHQPRKVSPLTSRAAVSNQPA
jgi:hypothetical protein